MIRQPTSPGLGGRLGSLARRLGLNHRHTRQLHERAAALRLPFPVPQASQESIWWQAGPQLQRLVELPRSALSGPIQEAKAEARALLVQVLEQRQEQLESIDLRQVDGLAGDILGAADCAHFEEFASSPACRHIRIISYKDFIRTIGQALPRFLLGERINLLRADWLGERLFWCGEERLESFACAVAYARLRGLETNLPAQVTHYRFNPARLAELQAHYHVLAMPEQAWRDPALMGLLLDEGLPYARLPLLYDALLLSRRTAETNALGKGLRQAGAVDIVAYLQSLPSAR